MKRKLLIVLNIVLILLFIKLLLNTLINNSLISKYNNGEYPESMAQSLTIINLIEPYVGSYNYGNVLYQNGKYENAMYEYQKALDTSVPEYKECNIRINYALSICNTVELDESSQDSIMEAIEKYERAIDILVEDGCANRDDDNGHNKDAQQLKNDIQKEIDRLKQLLENGGGGSGDQKQDPDEEKDENNNENNNKEEQIEKKIKEIKDEAMKQQAERDRKNKDYNYDFEKKERNW